MELVSLGKDVLQNIAEHAASYRFGQTVLRQLDRALWVVEKCARWAVPPPLDQDEQPQPELVRPLPWICFLMMLIALRVTRESMSLINLVMGKPPLRSADVVVFIQSKRRYLRTLKYQGNRMMRARTSSTPAREPWYNSIYSLFELTMCFRRQSNYGNNNTTRVSNNDEVMVVKRSKRGRQEGSPVGSTTETTMERLIEKMMVDLDAESDEDSGYTLTNATSPKSDRSELESESDTTLQNSDASLQNPATSQENPAASLQNPAASLQNPATSLENPAASQQNPAISLQNPATSLQNPATPLQNPANSLQNAAASLQNPAASIQNPATSLQNPATTPPKQNGAPSQNGDETINFSPSNNVTSSTPEKDKHNHVHGEQTLSEEPLLSESSLKKEAKRELEENDISGIPHSGKSQIEAFRDELNPNTSSEESALPAPGGKRVLTNKQASENLILTETQRQKTQKHKIANGRTVKGVPNKRKGGHRERRDSNDASPSKALNSTNSF